MGQGEGGGRPTLYREEYCDDLIRHMAKGFSFESFAATIGVNRDTLYAWEKREWKFSDSKKMGLDLNLLWWEQKGHEGLITGKDEKFNSSVWIFSMKNRHRWMDRQEVKTDDAGMTLLQKYISELTPQQTMEFIQQLRLGPPKEIDDNVEIVS